MKPLYGLEPDLLHDFAAFCAARGYTERKRQRLLTGILEAEFWLQTDRGVTLLWATSRDLRRLAFSRPSARSRDAILRAVGAYGEMMREAWGLPVAKV